MERYKAYRNKYFVVVIIFFILIMMTGERQLRYDYNELIGVTEKSEIALNAIKSEKKRLGLENPDSLLGPELTGITTTLGNIESKKITENPKFSVVIYRMIKQLGLKEGDLVAVQMSSSFPAANIETIIAIESLGLKPIIISSIGSSTHGATDEGFTYQDMEYLLLKSGHINSKSIIVTPGGDYDQGININKEALASIVKRLALKGYDYRVMDSKEENLNLRLTLYKDTQALINVGGNYISNTDSDIGYFSYSGYLNAQRLYNYDSNGLIGEFLSSGKDVIHIINIKTLADKYNLSLSSMNGSEVNTDGVYTYIKYSRVLLLVLMFLIICGEIIGVKIKNDCVHEICEKAIQQRRLINNNANNLSVFSADINQCEEFKNI